MADEGWGEAPCSGDGGHPRGLDGVNPGPVDGQGLIDITK